MREKLKVTKQEEIQLFHRLNRKYIPDRTIQKYIEPICKKYIRRYIAINPSALELRFTELIEEDIENNTLNIKMNNIRPDSSHIKLNVWSMIDIEKETGLEYGQLRNFMQSKEYGTILGKSTKIEYKGNKWTVFPAENAIKFSEAVKSYKHAQL